MAAISLRPVWFLVFYRLPEVWVGSGGGGGVADRGRAGLTVQKNQPPGAGDLCSPDWVDSEFTSGRSVGGWGLGGGGGVLVFGSTRCFSPLASVSLYRGLLAVSVVLPEPGSYDKDALLLINGGRERSQPVNNPEINLYKMPPTAVVSNVIVIFGFFFFCKEIQQTCGTQGDNSVRSAEFQLQGPLVGALSPLINLQTPPAPRRG